MKNGVWVKGCLEGYYQKETTPPPYFAHRTLALRP